MTLRSLGLWCALLGLCGGCSFVDPQAGAPQAACGISVGGATQSGQASSYYGSSSGQKLGATCAANPASACDDCEGTHCCATRSACYGDPVCACADLALDECLDAAETSTAAEHETEVTRCWDTFSAQGAVELARVACQRSWCKTECNLP